MIKNYLITTWRNLWKNKAFSAINIIGLSVGMAACIIILLFVHYEKSFDKQHTKNIYRLNEVQKFEGMVEPQNVALSMYPMGPTLKAEFPEIKNFTRVTRSEKVNLVYNEKSVYLPNSSVLISHSMRTPTCSASKALPPTTASFPGQRLGGYQSAQSL